MRSRLLAIVGLFTILSGSLAGASRAVGAAQSSDGNPVVAQQVGPGDGAGRLTLLHNNDGESSLLPIPYRVGAVNLPVGGVAAFKTVTDQNIAAARDAGNAVVNVYAGDAFLASATLACSLRQPDGPMYDAIAQRQIAYDAHIIGNHEFDYGPGFLARFIRAFSPVGEPLKQPFLSANLDFSREPVLADLVAPDGLIEGEPEDNRVLARSMILTDTGTMQRFGIVGATTPLLPTISSPGQVTVTATLTETAEVVNREIGRLEDRGVQKIIFVSHLQDISNDRELVRRLRGVDVAVAGGGDELLANTTVPTTTQLLPGELAPIVGPYPLQEEDADGRTVYIVTTAGNYKYLGRLDVEFDADGEVVNFNAERSYPRRVIPNGPEADDLGLEDAVAPDPGIVSSVAEPVQDCLDDLEATTVARTEVTLDVSRTGVRGGESNAGNLITDAFLYVYDQYHEANGLPGQSTANPVIAFQNGGGIRQNAGDILEDRISELDVFNVLPFDNFMTVITDVTPSDLKTIFERSVSSLPGQGGQFLQIAGLRITFNSARPAGNRILDIRLDDGRPLYTRQGFVPGAPNVTIITNSFTANGGDDYPTLAAMTNKTRLLRGDGTALDYADPLREYLRTFPSVNGIPTIPATDQRYQPGGEGRYQREVVIFLPIVANNGN